MSGTLIGYVSDIIARDLGFKGKVSVVAGAMTRPVQLWELAQLMKV